jgi:hypothetical protein
MSRWPVRSQGLLPAAVALCSAFGCGGEDPSGTRKAAAPLVAEAGDDAERARAPESVDGVLVLAAPAVDLAGLSPAARDRLDACRLAAGIADDIHWALGGPGLLEVRETLEQVLAHPGEAPPAITARVSDFATRIFLWQGTVDPRAGQRIRPRFIPGELAAAAEAASNAGANLPLPDSPDPAATRTERLEALLTLIRPLIFPGRGAGASEPPDASVGSGQPLPIDVGPRMERLRGLLQAANVHVAAAPPHSRPGQLIPGGLGPDLGVILGHRDRGDEPGFGALVAAPDPRAVAVLAAVAPREAALRRSVEETGGGKVPAGRQAPRELLPVSVLEATGAYGPVLDAGLFPLLDGPVVVDPDGDRVLLAVNLARALDETPPIRALILASSPDEETASRRLEHRECSRVLRHALAAMAGAGTDGTERRPPGFLANRLGSAAPVVEQLRALLAVLHLASAPVLADALPGGAACSRAILDDFAASAVEHLLDTPAGREGPAAVARRIALGRLLERQGLSIVQREGRVVLAVADEGKLRDAVAELLGEVRRLRYNGDGESARALVDRHGDVPEAWSASAAALTASIGGITTVAFVYPTPSGKELPSGIVASRIDRARRRALGRDAF